MYTRWGLGNGGRGRMGLEKGVSCKIVMCMLFVLLLFSPAWCQDAIMGWLGPEVGQLSVRGDYRVTYYPEKDVDDQTSDLELTQHDALLIAPVWQDADHEWSILGGLRYQDYDTGARLPDTGKKFAGELWNLQVGNTYRHRFQNGWIATANLTVGSPSDEPFHSWDEMSVTGTGVVRIPYRERHAWLVMVNYANNREFMPHVPIPGAAFWFEPSPTFRAVIGIPLAAVEFRPTESFRADLQYFMVRTVRARARYRVSGPVEVYLGFEWRNQRYFLVDRRDEDDRLFYYEKRGLGGATITLSRMVRLDLSGGYAFDRFYFEGETWDDRRDNRIDIEDGPFISARLGFRF